jgi:hypothetical protein
MMKGWEDGFRKYQTGILSENRFTNASPMTGWPLYEVAPAIASRFSSAAGKVSSLMFR